MIRRHGLPVEAMGIEDVEAKVRRALDGHALDVGRLVAEADGYALVVPLGADLVALAAVAAGALLALLLMDAGLGDLGEQRHVDGRTGSRALDHADVVAVGRLQARDYSV